MLYQVADVLIRERLQGIEPQLLKVVAAARVSSEPTWRLYGPSGDETIEFLIEDNWVARYSLPVLGTLADEELLEELRLALLPRLPT